MSILKDVDIPGFGKKWRQYTKAGGDCFFHAVEQGLGYISNIPFNYHEMRQNLSLWFQDEANAEKTLLNIGATPSELIPNLPDIGSIEPEEGWTEYLRGKDWKFWGKHIAVPGRWLGAIELPAANDLLSNIGFNVRVNIWDPRAKRLVGVDQNISKQPVIILYLDVDAGHFELLTPITAAT